MIPTGPNPTQNPKPSFFQSNPLTNGAISELLRTLRSDKISEKDKYTEYIQKSELGYIQVKLNPFVTRDVDFYKAIIASDTGWRDFETRTAAYFDDEVHPPPPQPPGGPPPESEARLKQPPSAAPPPISPPPTAQPFHLLQKARIERRFSSGTAQDIGERDLVDALSSLRYAFTHNFKRMTLSRRTSAAKAAMTILAIQAAFSGFMAVMAAQANSLLTTPSPTLWTLPGSALAAAALFEAARRWGRFMIRRRSQECETATAVSGAVVGRELGLRLRDLAATLSLALHSIDRAKLELLDQGRLNDWPTVSRRWTRLVFWLDARIEHIELYVELQAWRTQAMHSGLVWIGTILSSALKWAGIGGAVLLSAAGVAIILQRGGDAAWPLAMLTAALGAGAAWAVVDLARASRDMPAPDVGLIDRALTLNRDPRRQRARLHEQFAEHLFREKKHHLYEEEKLRR